MNPRGRTRTSDLPIRSRLLYPTELRAACVAAGILTAPLPGDHTLPAPKTLFRRSQPPRRLHLLHAGSVPQDRNGSCPTRTVARFGRLPPRRRNPHVTRSASASVTIAPSERETNARTAASVAAAVIETTKPRITRLVSITALVGLVLGLLHAGQTSVMGAVPLAIACVIGTALCASSANARNQWWERDRDARMPRTRSRPLPDERVTAKAVLFASAALGLLGALTLCLACGAEAAAIGLGSILIYVLIYTPMKPLTPWCTLVGAVPGALPPMIGWSAAMHGAELPLATNLFGGLSLFLLLLAWQMPLFWAIAWMYRDDYAAGGFKVLPVVDPDGSRTARSMRFWSLLLLPVSLLPWWAMPELIGPVYVVAAIAIGVLFARLCLQLAEDRSRDRARRVFFLSIIQLPLLLIALVADAFATVLLR